MQFAGAASLGPHQRLSLCKRSAVQLQTEVVKSVFIHSRRLAMTMANEDDVQSEDESSSEEPEPLDVAPGERKLVTQPYDYSVDQLVGDVKKGRIRLMEVPYQREYVWDDAKASRLVESLLLNVPIPVCYFAEDADGKWEVIDGLQRVQSIVRFMEGDLRLRGLSVLTEINDSLYGELPTRDQRRFGTRTLRFVVVTDESHPDIKFDVFERLNTGAVKLTPQELRNCIYRGTLNESLHKLATDADFRSAIARQRDNRMRDEELVLRFLALYSDLPGYKPPLSQFLNEFMRAHQDEEPTDIQKLVFRDTMKSIAAVFGGNAFQAFRDGRPSGNVNRALFDAVSLSFAFADRKALENEAENVRRSHNGLLENPDFLPLIGRATADRSRMHGRVRMYSNELRRMGIALTLPELSEE
jgi:hypothetical protein